MDKTVDSSDQQIRNSSSETDEEQEDQRRIQLSKDARELGNVRFKEGRLDEAIEQYTMAIRLAPEDPTAYTNRAFAYIKTERYASAEADCIAALKLDQKSIKALFRRALARKGLGHISEAIEDLKELLKLNPDNKSALSELNSLTNTTTEGNTSVASTPSSLIQTGNNNKQRKMRKIPIIEVDGNVRSCNPSSQKTTHTDSSHQVLPKTCSSAIKEVVNGTESLGHPTVKMTNSSSSEALKKFPSPTDKSIPSDSLKSSSQPVVNSTGDHNNPQKLPLSSSQSINITKPPSNWFQLEREIRELCRSGSSSMSYSKKLNLTKEAVIYLCNIQPTSYQALFGENMDSDFLSRMLYAFCQCVEDHGDQSLLTNHEITDRLLTLTKLSRFDVAWLMTDDVERVHAVKLIKHLQNDHSISKDIIKQICVQFECDD
ncbi:unnamed protein product [Trichobilharzia szidati]|nr:unnamed protein product [Trichobilharzia szidati]